MSVPEIDPSDFCKKWMPVFHDIRPDDWGFASDCAHAIAELTGYRVSTVNNWLNGNYSPPEVVRRYLGIIDFLLDGEDARENAENLDRVLREILLRRR